jgi:hypothetical protein
LKVSALFSLVLAAVAIAAPHGRRAEEHGAEHGAVTAEHETGATEHGAATTEHGAATTEHDATTTEYAAEAAGGEVYRPAPPGSLAAGSHPIRLSESQVRGLSTTP